MNTFKPLDEDFILDRIIECLCICNFQVKRSFENEYLFHGAYEQAQRWLLNHYEPLLGADSHKVIHIKSRLDKLNASFLEHQSRSYLEDEELEAVQVHNAKNQPVSKPAAPAQLPVFRVLGQVTKTQVTLGACPLSIDWRPSDPMPRKLFSITRPVGGLEQCH